MGYVEFQIEVIKALWNKDENQWPINEVWITSNRDGSSTRVPME